MSKRRKTPPLPSMDDLLTTGSQPVQEQKKSTSVRQDSKESDDRVKVTYYLPADLVDRIDEAHFKLGRMAKGTGLKVHKYDMARVSWELVLADFEAGEEKSQLTKGLFDE